MGADRCVRSWSGGVILVLLCALCSSCALVGSKRGVAQYEKLLPADTVFLVSLHDADRFAEGWGKTFVGDAWGDPAVAYWRSRHFDPVVDGMVRAGDRPVGLDLLGLIQGQATLAFSMAPDLSGAGAYFIADFGSNARKAREILGQGEAVFFLGSPAASSWNGRTLSIRLVEDSPSRGGVLAESERWERARPDLREKSDGVFFLDIASLTDIGMIGLRSVIANRSAGAGFVAEALRVTAKAAGLGSYESVSATVNIEDGGFRTRQATHFRTAERGLMALAAEDAPLRTPGWAPQDIDSFSVSRIRPPGQTFRAMEDTVTREAIWLSVFARAGKERLQQVLGMKMEDLLDGLGSEVAIMSVQGRFPPDATLLWEIRDEAKLNAALDKLSQRPGVRVERRSLHGFPGRVLRIGSVPFPVYLGEVDGFLAVSLQENRFEELSKLVPGEKSGESLLPVLTERFGRVPRRMTVSGYSYTDAGGNLAQLGGSLPLMITLGNMHLRRSGHSEIPSWVVEAVPPLAPFGRESFPMVVRTMHGSDGSVITESFSPYDPLWSPFLAAGAVVLHRYISGGSGGQE